VRQVIAEEGPGIFRPSLFVLLHVAWRDAARVRLLLEKGADVYDRTRRHAEMTSRCANRANAARSRRTRYAR
jgi:hypothetical protein